MSSFERSFERALEAASTTGTPKADAASPSRIAEASATLARTSWGDPAYHSAHEVLWQELERGLKAWAKDNLDAASPDEPMRLVWLYRDTLEGLPGVKIHVVDDMVTKPNFVKIVQKAYAARRAKGRGDAKSRVAARYPDYPRLVAEARRLKKAWKADDARVKGTEAFRLMGGLARITQHSARYSEAVRQVQQMERAVLGKVLTSQ